MATILAVYVATAPRTVVLEDDGEFITAIHFLGIAHPPGYPLFVLLAKPFTWLPIGSVAFRVHVATSFFAALSCGFVWWSARTLVGSAWIGWAAGLAFGGRPLHGVLGLAQFLRGVVVGLLVGSEAAEEI